jgi:Flp pilus assembly protein TadD
MRIHYLLVGLLFSTMALGDAVILKDGSRLEGTLKKTDTGWQVTSADGKVTNVAAANVKSIELGSRGTEKPNSQAGLASLRRSVEALPEIDQILERYERFIANTKDPAIIAEAQKDVATWQDRKARGLVKQGGNWVTAEEAQRIRESAISAAAAARDLLRQGRVAEGEGAIQKALQADPTNPAALYLRGVMLYRQDKLVDARKSFEAVSDAEANHAPTLNNLGVILWRQNSQGAALNAFDQAMQAQPVNRFILDNVAEALGALQDEARKGQAIQRVVRRFGEQDTILQKQLAAQGQYRWGSTWVDQKQLDELKAAEKTVQDQIAKLEQEFEANEQRIRQIDNEIPTYQRAMEDMKARTIWKDSYGKVHYAPLPPQYYEYQAKVDQLRKEQQSLDAKRQTLREQARRTQQQLPKPRFTGVMQIVGVEGTPLLEPNGAAPATSPSGQ